MKEFREIEKWNVPEDGIAIVLGRFDGVHTGHRVLIDMCVEIANERGLVPVCFSFLECTFPGVSERGQLTIAEEKARLLEETGIEVLLHPAFKPPLKDISAPAFLKDLLIGKWNSRVIIAGYDFRFGKDREGCPDFLREYGTRAGAHVEIVPMVERAGEPVKSTGIRNYLKDGKIKLANRLLGRDYTVHSVNKPGRSLGHELGFPTINLDWPEKKVKVPYGIYAVRIGYSGVRTGDDESAMNDAIRNLGRDDYHWYAGVANFGVQPTIDETTEIPVLEVHILDEIPPEISDPPTLGFGNLFRVEFAEFIRGEEKFGSVEELKTQIGRDCEEARRILSG